MKRITTIGSLVLLLAVTSVYAAKVIPSVASSSWNGGENFKASLKGAGKLPFAGAGTLTFDGAGGFTYTSSQEFALDGTYVQDGKKLTLSLSGASITAMEDGIAQLIEETAASFGLDAGEVAVNLTVEKLKLKTKLKVSTKKGNSIKLKVSAPFTTLSTTLGASKGKVKLVSLLPQVGA